MSFPAQVTKSWPGFDGIRNIVVFGDSYSSVVPEDRYPPTPTVREPLGAHWPGQVWNEEGLPNWVGHLITQYASQPRYDPASAEQDQSFSQSPMLVYDYAIGGETIEGVREQIQAAFLPQITKQRDPTSWLGRNTMIVVWFGINDLADTNNPKPPLTIMVELLDQLYSAGARNFLFIDVPPIQRSPALSTDDGEYDGRYEKWNATLAKVVLEFGAKSPNATVLLFSSHILFSQILDNPVRHGFRERDVSQPFGQIWNDFLHPTSKVHEILAHHIAEFLRSITSVV